MEVLSPQNCSNCSCHVTFDTVLFVGENAGPVWPKKTSWGRLQIEVGLCKDFLVTVR